MRKVLFAAASLLGVALPMWADSPLWLRYPAISPDGSTIAFCYQGDIFTVPTSGGTASQVTTNPAYDYMPVWSPDGSKIAFASDREGGFDVYIVDSKGGTPSRLTWHSVNETPVAFLDNEKLLYAANVMQHPLDAQFPSGYSQVYVIDVDAESPARPTLFSSLPMENISVNPVDGRILYTDMKGYEDPWRKHHQSSVTRDIWMVNPDAQSGFTKLTSFRGEDRNPVWAPDGKTYYYLSEQDGTFNVYKASPEVPDKASQLTHHKMHPVRMLTTANNGTMAYTYDGELYTLTDGAEPKKVDVTIVSDRVEKPLIAQQRSSGATDIAVSPSGKEVAFIMHGDVYVTSVEYPTTRRITDTPQQERNVMFSPDGRKLIYSAERGETWGIYESRIVRDDDKYFTYAEEVEETPLVAGEATSFQPQYSPDGKEVAFLEDRTTLRVINLDTKKVRTVLDGAYNYSYTDGDVNFAWSPDSRWLLVNYIGIGGWNNIDVALVKADGSGEVTNLTESGYSDNSARWALDGKAMTWHSDRAGYRSHGSWGAEDDVYIMFFDADAYDNFRRTKEEQALADEAKDNEKEKDAEKTDSDKDKKKGKKDKKASSLKDDDDSVTPLTFDLDNRRYRVIRLTPNSSHLADAVLSPKGDKLYYLAAFEDDYDLWEQDLKEGNTKLLAKGVGGGELALSKDGTKGYYTQGGTLKELTFADGNVKNISFRADFNYRPAQEREYIFNHAWRQVLDKFYDPGIHGVDWEGYRDAYARFLPHITNNYDFGVMLSEMLGELNASHTGARYYASGASQPTAVLGAYFDESHSGDGLLVSEVIAGGPLTRSDSKVTPGCIITAIDGKTIEQGADYYTMLAGKTGKWVTLKVKDPATGETFEQRVKPISLGQQSDLLYRRWVDANRKRVAELSDGKVGYIHVKAMDSESFREVFQDLLGRYRNCDAVVVDIRHNGGGWLHEDLAVLLTGKEFARFTPRDKYVGSDPFNRWNKPSCVLVCEDDYSNAHGFPWMYKTLGIGKLIGTPVPGTMTAVWWERQIDPSIVFGIPQVGSRDANGNYLENQELWPDIEVYSTPEQQLAGEDPQLERAVREMLETIAK